MSIERYVQARRLLHGTARPSHNLGMGSTPSGVVTSHWTESLHARFQSKASAAVKPPENRRQSRQGRTQLRERREVVGNANADLKPMQEIFFAPGSR